MGQWTDCCNETFSLPLNSGTVRHVVEIALLKYTGTFTRPVHLHPEDGNSMYLRNVGNAAHIDTEQTVKSRININNEASREPAISTSNITVTVQQSKPPENVNASGALI
jgi:hypothetical protein